MHNIKDLRKNLDKYSKKFLDRNFNFNKDQFENLDNKNRKLISEKEKLEQEKKYFQNQKIKIILKNRKRYLKNY